MKRLLPAATLMALFAVPALANPYATATSGGSTSSATSAPSSATATGGNPVARAKGGQGGNASANPVANGGQGGHVTNNIGTGPGGLGGGYPSNPRLAASAIAPTIISGGCAGAGFSAAIQLPGIGGGGGLVKMDRICQLHMIGEDAAARELLCQEGDIRKAFLAAGEPCAADLKPYLIAPARPVPVSTTKYPWDYCETRHAGDKDQHRECDHHPDR